jgi:hypothetical protein
MRVSTRARRPTPTQDTRPQFPGLVMWASYPGSTGYVTTLDATQLQGDIAEIVAVKGTLTDLEQTTLEGYLKKKYGL